jgi:hypothetical protein
MISIDIPSISNTISWLIQEKYTPPIHKFILLGSHTFPDQGTWTGCVSMIAAMRMHGEYGIGLKPGNKNE